MDALAHSYLNQCSLCNPGTIATEAEARKTEKYCELIDNGYNFQLVALEVEGFLGESSEEHSSFKTYISLQLQKKFLPVGWDSEWNEYIVVCFCYWSTGIVAGLGSGYFQLAELRQLLKRLIRQVLKIGPDIAIILGLM